jgi:hypothetical protein
MKVILILSFFACFYGAQAQGYGFVAKKGYKSTFYAIGTPLRIKLQNDSTTKAKGYYTKASREGIYLSPFDDKDTALRFIPVTHIHAVIPLERKARKKILYAAGGGLVLTGILVAATGGSSLDSPMGYILFLPAFASGAVLLYGLPVIYAKEFINKKSVGRGWTFVTQ